MDRQKLTSMVLAALFLALVLLLGMTPLGIIPLGFINASILCVPVLVGTFALGLKTGLLLRAAFGLTSTLRLFGIPLPPSSLSALLLERSPVLAIVMCMVPRLLVPLLAHGAYRIFARGQRRETKALPFAAVIGSLTNTVFYLGMMLLFFVITGLDTAAVLGIIGGTGLIAGGSEAVGAAILVTPITVALWKLKPQQA